MAGASNIARLLACCGLLATVDATLVVMSADNAFFDFCTMTSTTCALLEFGQVTCWGAGFAGQLGTGNKDDRGSQPHEMMELSPLDFGEGQKVTQLACGIDHGCALLDGGDVKCWGKNEYGQLGQGDTNRVGDEPFEMGENLRPVDLGTGRKAVKVSSFHQFNCALLDNAQVKCWGANEVGQLGIGSTTNVGDTPNSMGDTLPAVDFGPGLTVADVTTNRAAACARLTDDTIKCWGQLSAYGYGDDLHRGSAPGQMGDALPVVDLNATAVLSVEAGSSHTCARLSGDKVKCWGFGQNGRLGIGSIETIGLNPDQLGDYLPTVDFGANRTAKKIWNGGNQNYALLDNDELKAWGRNSIGVLGYGDTLDRGVTLSQLGDGLPAVSLGTGIKHISSHGAHVCVILDQSVGKCWGDNSRGQLGYGDNLARGPTPETIGDNLPIISLTMKATNTITFSSTSITTSTATETTVTTSTSTQTTTAANFLMRNFGWAVAVALLIVVVVGIFCLQTAGNQRRNRNKDVNRAIDDHLEIVDKKHSDD